jgi:hypothetical protein
MKTENFIWGLVLVFVGAILLLDNFDVIDFYWRSVWRLWPLVLIISGANIVFSGSSSKVTAGISIVITTAALGFIAYYGTRWPGEEKRWAWDHDERRSERRENHSITASSSFSEPYENTVHRATLNIAGGATVYTLEDTTSNLFDADVNNKWGYYSLQKVTQDSVEILNFKMRNHGKPWNMDDDNDGNKVVMRLNANPLWDINLETGAGKTEFDLTPFRINNLKVKGGAASFDVKLGEPEDVTHVVAETGVAEIKIAVPSSVGCKIEVKSGLSSRNFEGFTQQGDGSFTTSNYNSSSKKININLSGGLSEFVVDRY